MRSGFESEFADFEIAIDRGFIRSPEHEVFFREFFRGYFVNKSREKPFRYPEHWVNGQHAFERMCSHADGELDLAPIFRDRTYFVDSASSESVQVADICSHICLRYHRSERWLDAYRMLRPLIVDVNKGPMTLLVPMEGIGFEDRFATATQRRVAEHADSLPRRFRRG
jgi:hypothetical protein